MTSCEHKQPLQHRIGMALVVALLCALGSIVLWFDVRAHGQLHVANALAGVGLLTLALGISVPGKLRTIVDNALPILRVWKGGESGDRD